MAIKSIPIKDICLSGGTQQRTVDDDVMKRYAALMKDGEKFPEVSIIADGKNYYMWDGFHRYFSHLKLGKKYIEANVEDGTRRDAIFFSFGANTKNAFPRQPGTVKGIVEKMLKDAEWSQMSQNDIARYVRCTQSFVSQIASNIQAEAEKLSNNQLLDRTSVPGQKQGLQRSKTVKVKRGESEYEMKKKKKKVPGELDSTGKQVPKHLVKYFKRANEYRQMIKQLNDQLKTVREGKEKGDLFFKFIKIENLTAEIGNVKRIYRFAVPYAVCSYCGADENNNECRACDGAGFVNEMTYRATPKDLK